MTAEQRSLARRMRNELKAFVHIPEVAASLHDCDAANLAYDKLTVWSSFRRAWSAVHEYAAWQSKVASEEWLSEGGAA